MLIIMHIFYFLIGASKLPESLDQAATLKFET